MQDYIKTFFAFRKQIILLTISGAVFFGLFLYLVYPVKYASTVSILPPEQEKGGSLQSLMMGGDLSNLLGGGGAASSQLFAEIIKSRTAHEYVIRKLDLFRYFDNPDMTECVRKLSGAVNPEVTKEGILKITTELATGISGRLTGEKKEVQEMTAKISNTFAAALDSINRAKNNSKAKKARVYIESQLKTTKSDLDSAEMALMIFQKDNKAISLPEQIKVSIETAAKLKSEIITTEIKLDFLSKNFNSNNPSVIELQTQLQALRNEYNKLSAVGDEYLTAFSKAPSLGQQLANLMREVKVLNEVYLLLQQQYYKELIQENRDYATVEVLDPAVPPTRVSSPSFVPTFLSASIFIFFIVFLYYYLSRGALSKYIKGNNV
ncbi:MAG: hypothetical protein HUU43_07260 [Ignavibacteriaceae bacterium]|nr:hypothetical protein [Ignavibacteriaceae bacterium]